MHESISLNDPYQFEEAKLLNTYVLFTCMRIDRTTVPPDIYCYDIRHGDDDGFYAAELRKQVLVNHMGTVLSNRPFDLDQDGSILLNDEEDFYFTAAGNLSVSVYLDKYMGQCAATTKRKSRPHNQTR